MKFWRITSLFLFWIILCESFTVERIAIGIIISYLIAKLNEDIALFKSKNMVLNVNKITCFFKYLALLFVEIFKSNINVAKIVLSPKMNISPKVCTIETNLKSDLLKTILANSITLTPGTLTLLMDDNKITIHCLKEDYIKDLEGSSFEKILLKAEEY